MKYKLVILREGGRLVECHAAAYSEPVANAGASWAHWCPNDIVMLVEEEECESAGMS